MIFPGQQGLESLIIRAKDIPNADPRKMMRFFLASRGR